MQLASALVARTVDACWRVFTDPALWIGLVPGLRSAHVLARTPDGLPLEIRFAYAGGVTYVLGYAYDLDARVVRWEPRGDAQGAVRGFARFEPTDAGTRLVYGLEHDGTRRSPEAEFDDPAVMADAFARLIEDAG